MNFEDLIKQQEKQVAEKLAFSSYELTEETQSLQRSEEWFEQRRGKFTGSEIKKLMSVSRSGSGLPWDVPEKIIDLGDAAKKYIFGKAQERKTGKVLKNSSTKAMEYGTFIEPYIVEELEKELKNYKFTETQFIEIKKYLGASPDGLLINEKLKEVFGAEIKAPSSWDGYYRIIKPFDESHIDFWQIQTEMMALKVKKLYYIVAEPEIDIMDVLYHIKEPEIKELNIQIIESSPIHQRAILRRAKLCNKIINKYLKLIKKGKKDSAAFFEAIESVIRKWEF